MALVGTMGGLMINKRGGRKRQEKVRGRMKAIKGENTEQRAKQKEDPASPQSFWCSSSFPGCGHTLDLVCQGAVAAKLPLLGSDSWVLLATSENTSFLEW